MKQFLLLLSVIPVVLQAQTDSLYIYQSDYPAPVTEKPALAGLAIQEIHLYDEEKQVMIYTDTLDFWMHLAWSDGTWFSVPLDEYLDGGSANLGDVFFIDLTKDGREEMIAVFNQTEGRSGWQSGYFHETEWAIVWDFNQQRCLGLIPVSDVYDSWWVTNHEVFEEENAHLWEGEEEPELEYDGENSFDAMEVSIEEGYLVLRPAEITEENEYNLEEMSTCTYFIFWNADKNLLDYTKTCP